MAAVDDSFSAPINATCERSYQIVAGGVGQSIAGWRLHAQYRYATGDLAGQLALDVTPDNGLIVVTDVDNGIYKTIFQPADLAGIGAVPLDFDHLAIPPAAADGSVVSYQTFTGIATLTPGVTTWSRA